MLDVCHPDIGEFIDARQADGLEYFNLSVAVTSRFMRAVTRGGRRRLANPRTGRVTATVSAAELSGRICAAAWAGGDQGLLFTDRINRDNPLPSLGRIQATNPCGEVPLPYESRDPGSLDLAASRPAGGWTSPACGPRQPREPAFDGAQVPGA